MAHRTRPGEENAVDRQLYTREMAEVADLGMTWHRCNALLDTGMLEMPPAPA